MCCHSSAIFTSLVTMNMLCPSTGSLQYPIRQLEILFFRMLISPPGVCLGTIICALTSLPYIQPLCITVMCYEYTATIMRQLITGYSCMIEHSTLNPTRQSFPSLWTGFHFMHHMDLTILSMTSHPFSHTFMSLKTSSATLSAKMQL